MNKSWRLGLCFASRGSTFANALSRCFNLGNFPYKKWGHMTHILKVRKFPNQFDQIYTQGIGSTWLASLPAYLPVDVSAAPGLHTNFFHLPKRGLIHWRAPRLCDIGDREYLISFCFSSNLHHSRTSQKIKNTILLDFTEIWVRFSYRFSFTNKVKNCWPSPSSSFERGRWILRIYAIPWGWGVKANKTSSWWVCANPKVGLEFLGSDLKGNLIHL